MDRSPTLCFLEVVLMQHCEYHRIKMPDCKCLSCNEAATFSIQTKHIADAYCTGKWFDSYCNCMVCDYK
ncbi:hypothetical protein PVAP13_8KG092530 [Panicum virgatum]|uniref:Uncharacterized protein n=1 Tax=Panicum virgatum TaxID=38727 RepID=A0A8T0PGZ4_PANVG|nr:hypothetical protein PVAP13_8KG092530 [Panicum virgatum]